MTCLKRLRTFVTKGHRVTLISPDHHQYYSGMGPGMLGGRYSPQQIRFHIKKMAEDAGGAFLKETVVRVDPKERILFLSSGDE
jgi:NADH dehydrogenase FAD-containing subunit